MDDGFGVDIWNLPASHVIRKSFFQRILFCGGAYTLVILFAKLSVLLLYLRLFSGHRMTKHLVWCGLVCCCFAYTFGFIFPMIICNPWPGETFIHAFMSSRCNMYEKLGYMPRKKRIAVSSVFMLGFFGCICGVLHSYFRVIMELEINFTHNIALALITGTLEINVSIIVGCMPLITSTIRSRMSKLGRFILRSSLPRRFSRASNKRLPSSDASGGFVPGALDPKASPKHSSIPYC